MGNTCSSRVLTTDVRRVKPIIMANQNEIYLKYEKLWLVSGLAVGLARYVSKRNPQEEILTELNNPASNWRKLIYDKVIFKKYNLLSFPALDFQCTVHSIIFERKRYVIITYRGPEMKKETDWRSYLHSTKSSRTILGKTLYFHDDIKNSFEEVESKIKETLSIHITLLMNDSSLVESRDLTLIHNGSLFGGGLAVFSSLAFLEFFKGNQVCMTYGSNRVGGEDVKNIFDEYYHNKMLRIIRENDVIPMLPISSDYKSLSGGFYLTGNNNKNFKLWHRENFPINPQSMNLDELNRNWNHDLIAFESNSSQKYFHEWVEFLLKYSHHSNIPISLWPHEEIHSFTKKIELYPIPINNSGKTIEAPIGNVNETVRTGGSIP